MTDLAADGTTDAELIAAATVLLLRDAADGPEVLMLKRNSRIAFGGAWVFPGGRVDPGDVVESSDDGPSDEADRELGTARRAAARECCEEAGLELEPDDLVVWSHWQPPASPAMVSAGPRRRFSTWFFAGPAPDGDVEVDGGEIHEHRWLRPTQAIDLHRAGEIELVPPTWVTLLQLSAHTQVDAALDWARSQTPLRFHTKHITSTPPILTWHPDVFHTGGGADDAGPRHRLVMDPGGWVYERR